MTATRPASGHPWRSSIRNHVTEATVRAEIQRLEKSMKDDRRRLAELKAQLVQLTGGQK
jgi:cell division protein FtsL